MFQDCIAYKYMQQVNFVEIVDVKNSNIASYLFTGSSFHWAQIHVP